jgi:2-oxoglutarate ferredoxin oxidoreductase subunit alpha
MIGQMMEPVAFPTEGVGPPMAENDWALTGSEGRERRIVNSLFLSPEELDAHNRRLKAKYDEIAEREVRSDLYGAEGGYDLLVVAFGTMARIVRSAIDEVREEGLRVALFRPVTIHPFPYGALRDAMDALPEGGKVFNVEMSMGQMLLDVRLAAEGSREIEFHGTAGGVVPSPDEVADRIRAILASGPAAA